MCSIIKFARVGIWFSRCAWHQSVCHVILNLLLLIEESKGKQFHMKEGRVNMKDDAIGQVPPRTRFFNVALRHLQIVM